MAFFSKSIDKLKGALRKTWTVLNTDVGTLFIPGRQINEEWLVDVEERFIASDMGVKNVEPMIGEIRDRWRLGRIKNAADARGVVTEQILAKFPPTDRELKLAPAPPSVILVAGVNGAGKTTSIAKLAWLLKNRMQKKVMLCASDTSRAAAVDQLTIWADRTGA